MNSRKIGITIDKKAEEAIHPELELALCAVHQMIAFCVSARLDEIKKAVRAQKAKPFSGLLWENPKGQLITLRAWQEASRVQVWASLVRERTSIGEGAHSSHLIRVEIRFYGKGKDNLLLFLSYDCGAAFNKTSEVFELEVKYPRHLIDGHRFWSFDLGHYGREFIGERWLRENDFRFITPPGDGGSLRQMIDCFKRETGFAGPEESKIDDHRKQLYSNFFSKLLRELSPKWRAWTMDELQAMGREGLDNWTYMTHAEWCTLTEEFMAIKRAPVILPMLQIDLERGEASASQFVVPGTEKP